MSNNERNHDTHLEENFKRVNSSSASAEFCERNEEVSEISPVTNGDCAWKNNIILDNIHLGINLQKCNDTVIDFEGNGDLKASTKAGDQLQNFATKSVIENGDLKTPKLEVNGCKALEIAEKPKCTESLTRFEVNEYSIGDVRKLHEKLVKHQKPTSKASFSFFKGFDRKQKIVLACLCLVEFSSFCSISIMAPFFPKEALRKGMSETTAGLVFSFYAFVIFISSPFIGKVLPQVGAKFLFLSGLFLTSGCNFLFGLLGYIKQDWIFTLYCFVVQGMKALGASAYSTATYVFVAEVFPSSISSVLGVMETFVGLGMSIGPAVGGFFYHVGGFGLPFYILAVVLLLTFPVAFKLLPITHGNSIARKSESFILIFKEPNVVILGLVVVANSNVWGFLDPTLEPHLREFGLTSEKIGFIFLLFSALYGLSSPIWGIVSDKTDNPWSMITSGLLCDTLGLLLLGPASFLPFLKSELWLNLIALSILGLSVSLSLLPTFQGLISCIVEGGHGKNDITTYSIVSGLWSSLYALGEVIGPLVGGLVTEYYGFAFCCTALAGTTFVLAVTSCLFYGKECIKNRKQNHRYRFQGDSDNESDYFSDESSRPLLLSRYSNGDRESRFRA